MAVIKFSNKLFLTFDVEDFINDRTLDALCHILGLMEKRHQKGLFFITGHMAEKLAGFPQIVDLLNEQGIGYHSTSHSVHPTIFEYTDVENYQEAYQTSLNREIAHINPLSGAIEGRGGIEALRELFPHKKIESFRAPGFSWSPPHLEAMVHLGIKYDFSTNISNIPVEYKGIHFFPFPSFLDLVPLRKFLLSIIKRKITVVDFHPNFFVNEDWWDSIYFSGINPNKLNGVAPRRANNIKSAFDRFAVLLRIVDLLSKPKIINPCNEVFTSETKLDPRKVDIQNVYAKIALWPLKQFKYRPRFVLPHLLHFFEISDNA